eukprot:TRINITY_DN9308_c0_g1_i11.p2 TRINITY_DN9308_c0_g1~~TRINITY_DN9308_c0_g1_i11.p2  ORF type:complete len:163 (+),score=51.35 TRINITY_DN9308_c0_g1_i11:119-607(+)
MSQMRIDLMRDAQRGSVVTNEYNIYRKEITRENVFKKEKPPVNEEPQKDPNSDIVSNPLMLLKDHASEEADSNENNIEGSEVSGISKEQNIYSNPSVPKLDLEAVRIVNKSQAKESEEKPRVDNAKEDSSDELDDLYPKDMSTNFKVNIGSVPEKIENPIEK